MIQRISSLLLLISVIDNGEFGLNKKKAKQQQDEILMRARMLWV